MCPNQLNVPKIPGLFSKFTKLIPLGPNNAPQRHYNLYQSPEILMKKLRRWAQIAAVDFVEKEILPPVKDKRFDIIEVPPQGKPAQATKNPNVKYLKVDMAPEAGKAHGLTFFIACIDDFTNPAKRIYCKNWTAEAINKAVELVRAMGYREVTFLPLDTPGTIPPELRALAYKRFIEAEIDVNCYTPGTYVRQSMQTKLQEVFKEQEITVQEMDHKEALPDNCFALDVAGNPPPSDDNAGSVPCLKIHFKDNQELFVKLEDESLQAKMRFYCARNGLPDAEIRQNINQNRLDRMIGAIHALGKKEVVFLPSGDSLAVSLQEKTFIEAKLLENGMKGMEGVGDRAEAAHPSEPAARARQPRAGRPG